MTAPGIPLDEVRAQLEPFRQKIDQNGIKDFEALVELLARHMSREDCSYMLGAIARGPGWGLSIEPGMPGEDLWFRAIGFDGYPQKREELTDYGKQLRDLGFHPDRLAMYLVTLPEDEELRFFQIALNESREKLFETMQPEPYTYQHSLFHAIFLSEEENPEDLEQ